MRGEVGELVCKRPWPGMTRGIWGDPERYLETYWRRFPGVWTHGDWASVDEDGYWFLHGRSDDTLNVAGKRIGPAELESAAVGRRRSPRLRRSACRTRSRARCVALLRLRPGAEATPDEIAAAVAHELGKAFAPARAVRPGAAEDAQRQDRAARGARDGARHRPGRPLHAREPGVARGDRHRCPMS